MDFRILQVGCGMRGRAWTEVLDDMEGVRAVGYVDTNLGNAQALAISRGQPAFDNLEVALRSVDVEGVLVVTPPATHQSLLEQVLRYRLPILTEKPLADTMEGAVSIVATAEERSIPISVGMQFRYLPVTRMIRQLIDEGRYGQPGFALFTYLRNRDPYLPHLNWGSRYPVNQPHVKLLDSTIHHYDLMRYCYGSEPAWLQTYTWNPTWSKYGHDSNVASLMKLSNGVMVQYLGTFTAGRNELQFEWRTDCEGGIISQRSLFGDLFVATSDAPTMTPVPLESCTPFLDDSRQLLSEFVRSLSAGQPVPCSGREHLSTLAMVFGAIESAETGQRVDMDEFRRRYGLRTNAV